MLEITVTMNNESITYLANKLPFEIRCKGIASIVVAESRPTQLAVDVANAFCKCVVPQWEIREECGVCGKPPRH